MNNLFLLLWVAQVDADLMCMQYQSVWLLISVVRSMYSLLCLVTRETSSNTIGANREHVERYYYLY